MVSDRAFIFHICIPWGKTLSLVPKSRSSIEVKVKYQGDSFQKKKWPLQGHLYFTDMSCYTRDIVIKYVFYALAQVDK